MKKLILLLSLVLAIACGDDDSAMLDGGTDADTADADTMDGDSADADTEDSDTPDAEDDAAPVEEVCPFPEPSGTADLATGSLLPIGGAQALAVITGEFGVSGDRIVLVDLDSEEQTLVHTVDDAFSVGIGVVNGEEALFPSASSEGPGVLRFDISANPPTLTGTIAVGNATLPPRAVALVAEGTCEGGDNSPLDALSGTPSVLVLRSDYTSSALAVLDADYEVLDDEWFNSGSTGAGLVAALSGDVALPSLEAGGVIGVADRLGTNVITRLCGDGSLIAQARVSSADFDANLQDYIVVGDTVWATRMEQGTDEGNDLIAFSADTLEATGARVDFSPLNATVLGHDSGTMMNAEVQTLARPSQVIARSGHAVVGLARLPESLFGTALAAGEGVVAVIDPSDASITTMHAIDGLANCGSVRAVPGSDSELWVSCLGYSPCGFGEANGTRATAGLVRLEVGEDGTVSELGRWNFAE